MGLFPLVDPIPLPAPVWFFKVLHLVTLTLHFLAVHLLILGLVAGLVWAFMGRRKQDAVLMDASGMLGYRLPNVMAFVVNLAIPPLLFTQVLYGRVLFTSSVLIGVFWISVILLLIVTYGLLYLSSQRLESKKNWWWLSLIGLAIVLKIALIYSNNMTLMLRPEAWLEMYRSNPSGLHLASGDPTIIPRWVFMIVGSFVIGGIALILLGLKKNLRQELGCFLRKKGTLIAAVSVVGQFFLAIWLLNTQPASVRESLLSSDFYRIVMFGWILFTAVILLSSLFLYFRAESRNLLLSFVMAISGVLSVSCWVVFRDGIRDVTLKLKGFDVWAREVVVNWSVLIVFLLLFVVAVLAVGWMVLLVAKAKKTKEIYA